MSKMKDNKGNGERLTRCYMIYVSFSLFIVLFPLSFFFHPSFFFLCIHDLYRLRTEWIEGTTCFLSMSYIVSLPHTTLIHSHRTLILLYLMTWMKVFYPSISDLLLPSSTNHLVYTRRMLLPLSHTPIPWIV